MQDDQADKSTIVCVNEGRLRALMDQGKSIKADVMSEISNALDDCINDGVITSGNGLHIVNLNFQSVVGQDGSSGMISQSLSSWIDDKRSWSICGECAAHDNGCPIYHNHQLLALGSSDHQL